MLQTWCSYNKIKPQQEGLGKGKSNPSRPTNAHGGSLFILVGYDRGNKHAE